MGLPSKRRTKSSKRRRASHFGLGRLLYTACRKCGEPVLPHRVCLHCGTYNDRTVLTVSAAKKAEKKLRQREKQRASEDAGKEQKR